MNKIIGWILWKLGLGNKVMDNVKFVGEFYMTTGGGMSLDYIPLNWHYEWRFK